MQFKQGATRCCVAQSVCGSAVSVSLPVLIVCAVLCIVCLYCSCVGAVLCWCSAVSVAVFVLSSRVRDQAVVA